MTPELPDEVNVAGPTSCKETTLPTFGIFDLATSDMAVLMTSSRKVKAAEST